VTASAVPPVVGLRAVDEETLELMVAAAQVNASANEVTPPLTRGGEWTPERIEWMRAFHRERRRGLDGPVGEATWAVVADGEVVGAVRLKKSGGQGVLEIGIWLTRGARGQGVGRAALAAVVAEARAGRARVVRAETTLGNAAAQSLLRRLGFARVVEGDRVLAELTVVAPERQEPQVG
jgi:RimJ/RimL family protein N-acetyltransferase